MNKYIYILLTITLSFFIDTTYSQTKKIFGQVMTEKGKKLLSGATIFSKVSNVSSATDSSGSFTIVIPKNEDTLQISHIGYKTKIVRLKKGQSRVLVLMAQNITSLKEIVVSTGYQTISKERTTGSFSVVNNDLLNRSISTDILSRLKGVTSGLLFDSRRRGQPKLTIRGQSTIQSNPDPLIIVDNFPYEGDINNINPNDVKNITILKDAAAASIWGSRAGNGVIVITTKKGRLEQPLNIEFNSNITVGTKPDLFYNRQFLNSSDFIEVEKYLFDQGYYASIETSSAHPPLSPVVQLLIAERDGLLPVDEAEAKIAALKKNDVRDDFGKYFYRNSINQQYSLSFKGGSSKVSYYLSGGLDRNLDNLVRNGLNRFTINSMMTYYPVKSLELSVGLNYSQSDKASNNPGMDQIKSGGGKGLYPYARLADEKGDPLPVVRDFNADYVKKAKSDGLLDWLYRPLQDLRNADYHRKTGNIRVHTAAKYYFSPYFNIEGRYQFERQNGHTRNLQNQEMYYSRNMINQYAIINTDGSVNFPVPKGAILDNSELSLTSQAGRGQFNFNKNWNKKHQLSILGGIEIRQTTITGRGHRIYGYDDNLLISSPVDFTTSYLIKPYGYTSTIPNGVSLTDKIDRNLSYFGNASYTFMGRYMAYLSGRKDESNLFGVDANQKGVPLWSTGIGWLFSSEEFYPFSTWLPMFKLRATYGYSGNVNKSLTAYATANYYTDYSTGLPYVYIMTPPNPNLRWEKVKMINIGIDFETKDRLLSGSFEYYTKKGIDLIGKSPLDPTIGFIVGGNTNFTGNNSSLSGYGFDAQLNINKQFNNFNWSAQILYSYNKGKITEYDYEYYPTEYFSTPPPVPGNPKYSIYSLKWGGLDPSNGDPQVFIGGKLTKDYTSILSNLTTDDIIYNGPALPTTFGSFRNSFKIGGLSLGFNIILKFGYYFRKTSINYTALFDNWTGNIDYSKRWKRPGDDKLTQVPSMPPVGTSYVRDFIYTNSNILVEKGDHIRFQDINFSYELNQNKYKWLPFDQASIYGYINNIGIIWRANDDKIDPDYVFLPYPPPVTFSLGLKIQF